MYRATTPTHKFTLPIDTADCKEIQITYEQNGLQLIKHYQDGVLPDGMTLDGYDVIIKLSQTETIAFTPTKKNNKASVQVRVLTNTDDVYASRIFGISVSPVLNDEVLG